MVSLRLKGLSAIDPRSAPLPHGTEVTTLRDRLLPNEGAESARERRVPLGAVGRVVALSEGIVDVHIVGVGVVRYAREEVAPRKIGQARYAERRAEAWSLLSGCVVLRSTVGSRAWGLAHEGSDTDTRGVIALPFSWTSGLGDPPRDLTSEDGSTQFWEVTKAIRQALRADPNTLEMLFVDTVTPTDPIGEWLLAARDSFVSSEIYGSFGRYALSQLKRLSQSSRLYEHRTLVLEWLRERPTPDLDTVARRLAKASPRAAPTEADAVLAAKDYVKQLYRSLFDQGKLAGRDFASLVDFAKNESADLDLPRELRPKNAYNLVRLLSVAIGWLRTGAPRLRTEGALRDFLLGVKRGEVPLSETLLEAERLSEELERARQASVLPARPDVAAADDLVRKIQLELARRFVSGVPGPFGQDAPPCPSLVWEGEASEPPAEEP